MIFKIQRVPLNGYFWPVHATICCIQYETQAPDKWTDKWPVTFIGTLLESHICNKKKKNDANSQIQAKVKKHNDEIIFNIKLEC